MVTVAENLEAQVRSEYERGGATAVLAAAGEAAINDFSTCLGSGADLRDRSRACVKSAVELIPIAKGGAAAATLIRGALVRGGEVAAAAEGSSLLTDLLMPGGSAIGKAGKDETIREIAGGLSDAKALFDQLSRGGKVVADTPKFTRVKLPNGGFVQLRTVMSRSPRTAATIDVNIPGIDITKLKFNP